MKKCQGNPLFRYSKALLFLMVILLSCSRKHFPNPTNYHFKDTASVPNYSNIDYWASHPWKEDAADHIPYSIKDKNKDTLADVFFIHPTTYTEKKMRMGWNAAINDSTLNRLTDESSMLYQASVFNRHCRIFAPRYRQANLEAFFTDDKVASDRAFDLAYADIKKAFIYYLQNYNRGRPLIIASHSQGTLHATRLLKEFFEGKPLQSILVAAYIPGLPVFRDYFTKLISCSGASETGCFVTWRTFKENYIPSYVKAEKEAYVINPLTWSADKPTATARMNRGGLLWDFDRVIPKVVRAKVNGNILWVNKPRFFGNIFLTQKNYHIADYNLFYMNIRENIEQRIRAYLALARQN